MTTLRPVWITQDQKRSLVFALGEMPPFGERGDIADIIEAWNAAPADPVKALMGATQNLYEFTTGDAKAVLAALGMPNAE